MKKDEIVYLKHIFDAISDAQKITQGIDENRFAKDIAIRYATVRCIEITGEGQNCKILSRRTFLGTKKGAPCSLRRTWLM